MADCITADSILVTADSVEATADLTCCPIVGELVDVSMDEILTQYRESPLLLGLIRAYLGKVEDHIRYLCNMFSYFDLDTAVGDQLTIAGKVLGFPRCHCVCEIPPVFGYDCDGAYSGPYTIAGYCEPGSTWVDCPPLGNSEICIDDDSVYRRILKARRYQMLGLYDIESLQDAIKLVWGNGAQVANAQVGQVVLSPGRALTAYETTLLPIVFRVFPIAPGIKGMVHLGYGPIFGYGEGWGGYCEGAELLCPMDPHAYTCA